MKTRICLLSLGLIMIQFAMAQEKLSVSQVNAKEFAPGYPQFSMSALQQLKQFPAPRFRMNADMPRNFPWYSINYLHKEYKPGVYKANDNPAMAVALSDELCNFWNYYLEVPALRRDSAESNSIYANPSTVEGALVQYANAHPEIPVATITYQMQNNGKQMGYDRSVYIKAQDLPANYYLCDASGKPVITGGRKWLSPLMPLDIIRKDGLVARMYLRQLQKHLKQPIRFINENGEAYGHIRPESLFNADPKVAAMMKRSGLSISQFNGAFLNRLDSCYKATILEEPAFKNTLLTFYNVSYTQWQYWPDYRIRRNLNSKVDGEYHSTPSVYVRKPPAWSTSIGPANGFGRVADGRQQEMAIGERFFSPFIAAGWGLEENNIRPAQWLGLLKALGVLGADFYYTGYFNVTGGGGWANGRGPNDPAGYIYQVAMPVYAQAITERFREFLLKGKMLNDDGKSRLAMFRFLTKDPTQLIIARKMGNKYLLYGTIQNNTNQLNAVPYSGTAVINLEGKQISFDIRRQGSTYILDLNNPSKPIIVQLDGWHQYEHPSYWTTDIRIEGELAENDPVIATEGNNLANGNYTGFVSYAILDKNKDELLYSFFPRKQTDYACYVRARSVGGNAVCKLEMNNGNATTIAVNSSTWKWYRVPTDAMSQIKINKNNPLSIKLSSGKMEIDVVLLSFNKNLY